MRLEGVCTIHKKQLENQQELMYIWELKKIERTSNKMVVNSILYILVFTANRYKFTVILVLSFIPFFITYAGKKYIYYT